MNLGKSIRLAVDTGKTVLGSDRAKKLALTGGARLLLVARNCRSSVKQDLLHYSSLSGVPVVEFPGTSIELGIVCGKPFPISAISVIEPGNSDILSAVQQ